MFRGRTFASRKAGREFVKYEGFETIVERGLAAAEEAPAETVYIGFSLGTVPAQMLAQTRLGARGAVLCYAFTRPTELGSVWPATVPVQIHAMERDALVQEALEDAR